MLSKIKSSPFAVETRSSLSNNTSQASDNEDEIDNDTNNNNNNNNNHMNNNQQSKKTQEELLDIVETSRKRRISKDSADSLTSFIRWSFSHIDPSSTSAQRITSSSDNHLLKFKRENVNLSDLSHHQSDPLLDDDELPLDMGDEDDWSTINNNNNNNNNNNSKFQSPSDHMLSRRQKLLSQASGSSSAANLASLMKSEKHLAAGGLLSLTEATVMTRGSKRPRMRAVYSPEAKYSPQPTILGGGPKKSSSYLGNVVERLHQQQQLAAQQQEQQQQQQQQQQELEQQEASSNAGLSYHLQQFLQQQTSLEDLCSSVGLDDGNQLVLAAAIHRALVDSVGPNGGSGSQATGQLSEAKSTASSTGSSSGVSSSNNNNNNSSGSGTATSAINASGANLHLVDSLQRGSPQQQSRVYNTRGAASLHGLNSAAAAASQRQQQGGATAAAAAAAAAAMNMSNRVQQQRHAQAAAALSALASAGSHGAGSGAHLTGGGATPMVDFECDTCGSSFDDRHRLMQHQSIHLELKKDWFTETPVDEVMKIFNRRRGEFLCNTCNLRFEATFDYDKHNHSVHGQRPYCCQFCGNGTRTFRFWRQYLNHLYDHRYIFSCTIDDCDFTVNRRDSLRFHIFRFHLNCQLPQNQQHQQQLRFGQHNMLLGANNNNNNNNNNCNDSKWPTLDDEDLDQDNDMSVGE